MSFDYKLIIQGLKVFSQICNDSVSKLNIVELSDLVYKWTLLRVYDKSANEITLQTIN